MNTVVSVASVASATAIAAPSIASEPEIDLHDPKQILKRAEQAIEAVREMQYPEYFTVNEEECSRALRWFRELASGVRGLDDESDEWSFVLSFLIDNGLSLDWIFTGDVTPLLRGSISKSRRARRTQATNDPVFQALARTRDLEGRSRALGNEYTEADEKLPAELRRVPRVPMYHVRDGECVLVEETEDFMLIRHERGPLLPDYYYAESVEEIERNAKGIPAEHREAWIADRVGALERETRAQKRALRKCGFMDIESRSAAADEAYWAADRKLLKIVPTTLEGANALVSYVLRERDLSLEAEDGKAVIGSLAKFIKRSMKARAV